MIDLARRVQKTSSYRYVIEISQAAKLDAKKGDNVLP